MLLFVFDQSDAALNVPRHPKGEQYVGALQILDNLIR